MKKKIIILICIFLILAMIPVTALVTEPALDINKKRKALSVVPASQLESGGDKIHFLNTGSSDAILLESQGKFALIDAAEDTDNPRGFDGLNLEGYEEKVVAYLKANAADENGIVHLDFVLGTHSHSDHIGGFDTVISDPDIEIGRAYLKEYDSSKIADYEVTEWDNQEVYDQMYNALVARDIPIISKPDGTPFKLGNFTITLFNTSDPESSQKVGENDQSFGVLVEKNGTRVFLAGDIDNNSGDEDRLAPEIGKVHLLKVGHHSYHGSTSSAWVKTLMPDYCVVTNKKESVEWTTLWRISRLADSTILITGQEDGVIAEIGDNGTISFSNKIHES